MRKNLVKLVDRLVGPRARVHEAVDRLAATLDATEDEYRATGAMPVALQDAVADLEQADSDMLLEQAHRWDLATPDRDDYDAWKLHPRTGTPILKRAAQDDLRAKVRRERRETLAWRVNLLTGLVGMVTGLLGVLLALLTLLVK